MANDRVGYLGPRALFPTRPSSRWPTWTPLPTPHWRIYSPPSLTPPLIRDWCLSKTPWRARCRPPSMAGVRPRPRDPARDRPAHPSAASGATRRVAGGDHQRAQLRARPRPGTRFLHDHEFETVQTTSTSQAASDVAQSSEPWGAVGSALAGQLLGLDVVAPDIEDHPDNATRFVLVGRDSGGGPDRSRSHHDRLLPGRRPPGLPLRHPRSFRRARYQPHQTRKPTDQARTRVTTASSLSSRDTSPTTWWPTALADLAGPPRARQVSGLLPRHR
jgi:hypothetical protein